MNKKFAVILFNIGGPDQATDQKVKKYLKNFFSDKFIIRTNFLLRKLIAFMISTLRYKKTQAIYNSIGGSSPVLRNTFSQADSLKEKLGEKFDIYCAMRYWNPFASEIIHQMKDQNYEQIILLPLYPQCSSTTTVSAYENWIENVKQILNPSEAVSFLKKTKLICKHFDNQKYIDAMSNLILNKFQEAVQYVPNGKFKLFFSAHSIPEFLVIKEGDPYQDHIIQTVEMIIEKLKTSNCSIDYIITYQSKVGKLKWLEPMTDAELVKAAKENIIPIIVPVAFVSENSETLYELDIEYKELLEENGMQHLFRVSALGCDNIYIDLLRDLVNSSVKSDDQFTTKRSCNNKTDCPCVKYLFIE
jgi:ferrochelatase